MRPINLMQIVFTLEVGGLEYLVLNLVKKLNKNNFNISVCSLTPGGKLEGELKRLSIPVYHVEKRTGIDFTVYFKLARLFCEKKVDIIHTHNPTSWFYGVMAGKFVGVKSVHTEHSYLFPNQKKLMFAEKILSLFTNSVVGDSVKVTEFLINKLGIDRKKVCTIVNGIDVDKFVRLTTDLKSIKKKIGIREDCLVVGTVARLETVKNQAYLIDIFSCLVDRYPNVLLIIVGGGSQESVLRARVTEQGLKEKVLFLGPRDDVPDLLKLFDIFALTSVNEGISLGLLEAMASGLPVVATDVGGNPDVVVDKETGFLIPLEAPDKAALAFATMLENRELARRMGQAGKARVESIFGLDTMVKRYESIYDSLLVKR